MRRVSSLGALLICSVAAAALFGACSPAVGGDGSGAGGGPDASASGAGSSGTGASGAGAASGRDGSITILPGDSGPSTLSLDPPTATLTVDPGSGAAATVRFALTGPGASGARWIFSNDALGYVDQNGVFTASGKLGGEGDVQAFVGNDVVKAHVVVNVSYRQNGATSSGDAGAGAQAGGLGGVGGEGFGGALGADVVSALEGAPSPDSALKWLYPYDQTVFPLNVLPPLLQWSEGTSGAFDGVYVHLTAAPYYEYKGFFGRPAGLAPGASLVRHPIPRDVWDAATRTAAGSTLTVELVLAAGGKAYGPIRETYKIALGKISGKIYYQAYNTALAKNYDGALSGGRFGGATLSIKVGDEGPLLVAGKTSSDISGCRVCHSVSAYGDRMVVQQGPDYSATSTYDLKNGNQESSPYQNGQFGLGWTGLYPDGTLGLSNDVDVAGTGSNGGVTSNDATLYDMASGAAVPTQGLSSFATKIGLPMFSPDGKHVAFTLFQGPSTAAVGPGNGRKLVVMDFDVTTKTFSNPRKLWETTAGTERPAWPTFFPSSSSVVFVRHFEGTSKETFASRYGAKGELWWVDLATQTAAPLATLNGASYLPRGSNAHDADEVLQYEPTISPVASGGYAWIVFMSRRRYGNVATIDPWWSDPREHDLQADVTTKKIWMAALDLDPQPGKDPSHPAFYIPGQELHGSNSRPFFALEPCVTDRGTCSTGIDCCTGFCRDGLCVAPPTNQCSNNDERCTQTSDCCDARSSCIGGFCAKLLQ
jgi:hypothetical protein